MKIFDSFWNEPIFAGYSLSSFDWWVDIFVILGFALVVGGIGVLLNNILGKNKLENKAEADEAKKEYKSLKGESRKNFFKSASTPIKNILRWNKTKKWLIPVSSVLMVISLVAVPVLPVAGEQILITLQGSKVTIYDTESSIQAAAEARENVVTIEEEGIVLLKNENNTLPLNISENKKVNIFGSCSFGMLYGNGGSGTFATDWSNGVVERRAVRFNEAMDEAGFEYNPHLYNIVANNFNKKGTYTISDPGSFKINTGINTYNYAEIVKTCIPYEYEVPAAQYTRTDLAGMNSKSLLDEAKEYSDTAIYTISRYGTESQDMNTSEMQLKTEEVNMINMIKENFDNVIILINAPIMVESGILDDEKIDSVLFVGSPGLTGTKAIAKVLKGEVNPSGHLVDTWVYDAKSAPSYQSFGNDTVLTYTAGNSGKPFVEFVEGIYVGYRYYVTRAKTDTTFNYDDYVQWSFGHGLSYTTFDKNILSYSVDQANKKIEISVEVTNTGDVPGKDVIQIYTHAPYNPGGVEKSWFSLTAFTKTNLIPAHETKNYKIEFSFRDMASWDNTNAYYVLEKGDYEISLRDNVWDEVKSTNNNGGHFNFNLANDIKYFSSYQTDTDYTNLFADVEHGPCDTPITYLSRNDWEGTWTKTSDINRAASADKLEGGKALGNWNFEDNQIEGPTPTTGAHNSITLRDLKDADWDDERWEDLLDNLTVDEMKSLIDNGGFKTSAASSISKAESRDYDGPASAFHSGTGHPSEVALACSWNVNIAKLMGQSIGKEGAARGITGWYAPGINIHRNPYGGRNFEYYSEDPLISGMMAGYTSQGLAEFGVYAYAKHFALNEQEKNREELYCWASEQAIREIYAKGFEHYVNLGGLGIMTSFNKVGSYWAGANKSLLTGLLREEWGFHGVVVTDYCYNSTMGANVGLRAGNDLWLIKNGSYGCDNVQQKTPNDAIKLFRRACKNILFACAHSNNVWTIEDYQAVGIDEVIKATDRS
ncbi:MAG: glycoside hydrolase family 3 C-terminal domain-containing protein [Bacilli bacterium]|nr:glycoside hydrolase family 3 C-terminal domain-containing protein [Bacilli bacterium]